MSNFRQHMLHVYAHPRRAGLLQTCREHKFGSRFLLHADSTKNAQLGIGVWCCKAKSYAFGFIKPSRAPTQLCNLFCSTFGPRLALFAFLSLRVLLLFTILMLWRIKENRESSFCFHFFFFISDDLQLFFCPTRRKPFHCVPIVQRIRSNQAMEISLPVENPFITSVLACIVMSSSRTFHPPDGFGHMQIYSCEKKCSKGKFRTSNMCSMCEALEISSPRASNPFSHNFWRLAIVRTMEGWSGRKLWSDGHLHKLNSTGCTQEDSDFYWENFWMLEMKFSLFGPSMRAVLIGANVIKSHFLFSATRLSLEENSFAMSAFGARVIFGAWQRRVGNNIGNDVSQLTESEMKDSRLEASN